jgi:hypothetical protein
MSTPNTVPPQPKSSPGSVPDPNQVPPPESDTPDESPNETPEKDGD